MPSLRLPCKVVINKNLSLGHKKKFKKYNKYPGVVYNTYIFKSVLAELHHEVKKDQGRKPQTPHNHLFHRLNVQYPKDENELVKYEVPKLIFQVLRKKNRVNKMKTVLGGL